MSNPSEEIVQIVDQENQEIGAVSRKLMREQRLIHRACYILVFNPAGELFIQKRTLSKDIYPGYWDVAAGGVVLDRESYEESAERELAEELGVCAVKLEFVLDQYYEDENNRVWGRVFRCIYAGPFVLQAEEVESGQFLQPTAALKLAEREPFTPDGLVLLRKILNM
ncbi:Isopentenyldiphosphate isomerase [Candidatus Electronema aureum]